jgi:Mg-chelatase subunit ChlD
LIEFTRLEVILLVPFFIALTLMSHYFAQKIKRSLEVFHYPPVSRLIRMVARKGVQRHSWRGISLALKIATIMLIAFSLAGPTLLTISEINQTVDVPMVEEKDIVGGILLAIDVSASMGLEDVAPSRLEASRNLLIEFVKNSSENVRFGVVAFDSEIKNSLPLTVNKENVVSVLEELRLSEGLPCLEETTDIGYGLQTAVSLLSPYDSSNGTYVVIVISDGFANYGYPDPFSSISIAIEEAVSEKVPIYPLHVAKIGMDSNPELLEWIADETNGKFMYFTSTEELRSILDILAKYHTPTSAWSTTVEIKTTVPLRTELGHILMFGAAIAIILLWIGNYKHYKTWF